MIYTGQLILGAFVLLTGINYVPLLVYAVVIVRAGSASKEIEAGMTADRRYVRKYSAQQPMIFVPLLILGLSLKQELTKEAAAQPRGPRRPGTNVP